VLLKEGQQFERTLETGMVILDAAIARLGGGKTIDGETVFKLYDTYGFPVDLTNDIARERGLAIDSAGYEAAMQRQREQSQAASKFGMDMSTGRQGRGQDHLPRLRRRLPMSARWWRCSRAAPRCSRCPQADEGEVFLDRTPFYAESGGQVGDTGELGNVSARFVVADTLKRGSAFSHVGKLAKGEIRVGDKLAAQVDAARRKAIMANHTATHLLHAALRQVLGTHVQQKGSLVAPDRLRFDFSHFQAITPDELRKIERLVNAEIRANAPGEIREMPYDAAVAEGAIALFGEKYEKDVRVLRLGSFSMELVRRHPRRAHRRHRLLQDHQRRRRGRRACGASKAITAEGALDFVENTDQLVKDVAGTAARQSRRREGQGQRRAGAHPPAREGKPPAQGQARERAGHGPVRRRARHRRRETGGGAGGRRRCRRAAAMRSTSSRTSSRAPSSCWPPWTPPTRSRWWPASPPTRPARSRPANSSAMSPARWAVRAAAARTFAQAGGNNPAALGAALASVESFVRAKLGA
jgi:alanyl-tRNA synthetase